MRIYTDQNDVRVNAITAHADGTNVEGREYQILAGTESVTVNFQNGAVQENGVNGVTNEALLAILIHRTKLLDSEFGCNENKRAIQHMEEALVNFEVRPARRMVRGVEGQEVL